MHNQDLRIPQGLQKGDTIGIAAPAAQLIDLSLFSEGIRILKEMGFVPVFPRDLWPGDFYLADTDIKRASEFNKMWADPSIKAIMAVRGGFGCIRMAPYLDKNALSEIPKLLIGFSDITFLHATLFSQYQLMSLHGPVLTALPSCSNDALQRLHSCLTGKWKSPIYSNKFEIIKSCDEPPTAPLIGGNLSTLMTSLGTAYDFDYTGKYLFLEDVGEPQYKLDRMFTQLKHAGKLNNLSGLLLGDFSNDSIQDEIEKLRYKEFIWNRIVELTKEENYTIIGNFPIGHCSQNLSVPYGCNVKMDIHKKRILFV